MRPILTSLQNPTVKNLVKLRQRRQRDKQRLMLIDGGRALRLALQNNVAVQTVFIAEAALANAVELLQTAQQRQITIQPVSQLVFEKIGYGDSPDGVLGLAPQPDFSLQTLPCPPNPLYLIAEGIEKPGNLGAILRSADAAGVTGLILCNSQTDVYNPNVIRASRGAFFSVPLAVTDTRIAIHWLHENNVQIAAATPVTTQFYTAIDFSRPAAIAVGAEHSGLSATWLTDARISPVKIPMYGQVDSLNVAQSASILIYEALRQRQPSA